MKAKAFHFITGDINYLDYGGTWSRKLSGNIYHFICLINWEDSCGSDAPKEKYNVGLSEVNLDEISGDLQRQALESCGDVKAEEIADEWIALSCFEYGLHAPLWSENGNNFKQLFKQAATESTRIQSDLEYREERMTRPVNRLGSTAEEYMRGDLDSALFRGLSTNDPSARIIAKMQGIRMKEETR